MKELDIYIDTIENDYKKQVADLQQQLEEAVELLKESAGFYYDGYTRRHICKFCSEGGFCRLKLFLDKVQKK